MTHVRDVDLASRSHAQCALGRVRSLPDKHYPIQAFFFDRAYEALSICIQIRGERGGSRIRSSHSPEPTFGTDLCTWYPDPESDTASHTTPRSPNRSRCALLAASTLRPVGS